MFRVMKKRSKRVGLPPGTLVPAEEKRTEKVRITLIDYDEANFDEKQIRTIEESFPFRDKSTVTWINCDGVHDLDLIEKIGRHFGLHPLTLEDIVDTEQRPKLEDFEDYLFIVLKMLYYDEKEDEVQTEQVSLILGPSFVISFQEREGDVFDPIRERLGSSKGRIRKMGADYLAYALIDTVVDNYFIILEQLGKKIESLEEELVTDPVPETVETIHHVKRAMISLRRSVWPLREVLRSLEKTESELIRESTNIYLGDVYDHTIQVIDTIESSRDVLSGMVDIYLSTISNRMNQVMKVLTIVATIFIPLTFVAGIYGMNFQFMPELEWRWGYLAVLVTMVAIGVSMVAYFRRKKWL